VSDEQDLADLKTALLRGLRTELPEVEPGYAAFERHQLLAIRFHRAARLNAPEETERQGWLTYFREHFPRGDEHARRLWEDWRGRLVKDEFPGEGVAVSHGQPHAHWQIVDPGQRLFLDLESLADDFERSVGSFVGLLGRDATRRARTLEKWQRRQWSVQQVTFVTEQIQPRGVLTTASTQVFSTHSASASGTSRVVGSDQRDH